MVHLFDEVLKAVPDGVYLTSIKQSGTSVAIEGIAQSNARVSAFMRNIDTSHWLAEPKLDVIEALSGKNTQKGSSFKLNLKEVMEGEGPEAADGMPKDTAAKGAAKPVAPRKAGVKTGKKS